MKDLYDSSLTDSENQARLDLEINVLEANQELELKPVSKKVQQYIDKRINILLDTLSTRDKERQKEVDSLRKQVAVRNEELRQLRSKISTLQSIIMRHTDPVHSSGYKSNSTLIEEAFSQNRS
jgi:predicted  nucleic acid-binding Zn-ribbon protein